MAYANNAELCHEFWYAGDKDSGCHNNVSYNGQFFYSYGTVIGVKVRKCKSIDDIYMVSSNGMTSTTSTRHLPPLKRACPGRIEYIPLEYGDSFYDEKDFLDCMYKRIVERIEASTDKDLKQAPKRRDLLQYVYLLNMFCENFDVPETQKSLKAKCEHIETVGRAIEIRNQENQEKRREAREEREYVEQQLRTKRLDAARVELDDLITRTSYLDVVRGCFGSGGAQIPFCHKPDFRDILRGKEHQSFVWVDGDSVKTSQSVTLPIAIVQRALRQWRQGLVKVGASIGQYTLREISKDVVQIGCHRIPMRNILELEKAIMA